MPPERVIGAVFGIIDLNIALPNPPVSSEQLNITGTFLRRILHKFRGMKAYKAQYLKPRDHPMCFRFAEWAND